MTLNLHSSKVTKLAFKLNAIECFLHKIHSYKLCKCPFSGPVVALMGEVGAKGIFKVTKSF